MLRRTSLGYSITWICSQRLLIHLRGTSYAYLRSGPFLKSASQKSFWKANPTTLSSPNHFVHEKPSRRLFGHLSGSITNLLQIYAVYMITRLLRLQSSTFMFAWSRPYRSSMMIIQASGKGKNSGNLNLHGIPSRDVSQRHVVSAELCSQQLEIKDHCSLHTSLRNIAMGEANHDW